MKFTVVGIAPGNSGSKAFWHKLPQSEVAKIRSITETADPAKMKVLRHRLGEKYVEFLILQPSTIAAAKQNGLEPVVLGEIEGELS
jgi:hypothetical protein